MNRMNRMNRTCRIAGPGILVFAIPAGGAEVMRPEYTPPSVLSMTGILQLGLSLGLVLAVVGLVAWLLKRLQVTSSGPGNQLKLVGSLAVGQRERVVLVEVQEQWLVLGVAPGNIRALHALPKPGGGGASLAERAAP